MVAAAVFMFAGVQTASAADTVTISGKAFVFNHMNTYISGATIKVREFPKLSTVTNDLGDYELVVPDDANVTPYILSGDGLLTKHNKEDDSPTGTVQTHWNEIDLQTFHTRGQDIENANFQSPQDAEFNGLKALLSVPAGEDGRPTQCAIVTTASARNVRGVDYRTYWENTPHGVPGATSIEYSAIEGPVYFNEFVIPDKTKTSTSEDGGIIWPVVPTGSYRISTSAPAAEFASFLATCAPGRIINANPPWGAYQLNPGEKPLGASNVAAKVTKVKAYRKGKSRMISIAVNSAEALTVGATFITKGLSSRLSRSGYLTKPVKLGAGSKVIKVRGPGLLQKRKVKIRVHVTLRDSSGVGFTKGFPVTLPKLR